MIVVWRHRSESGPMNLMSRVGFDRIPTETGIIFNLHS